MPSLTWLETCLFVLGVAPFAWTAIVWLARSAATSSAPANVFSDLGEKTLLGVMLAPISLGVLFLALPAQMTPSILPPPPGNGFVVGAAADASIDPAPDLSVSGRAMIVWAVLTIYIAGAALAGAKLISAFVRLQGILAAAQPTRTNDVLVAAAEVAPFAAFGRRIVIPQDIMSSMSDAKLALIVDHERAHLRRGDPLYFLTLAAIDAVFWFNPFVHRQTTICRLAAELACDAAVVAARPGLKRLYAETLIEALARSVGEINRLAPAVHSTCQKGENRMRIEAIMGRRESTRRTARAVFASAALLAAPVGALQWASAQSVGDEAPNFDVAVLSGRLTSGFGQRRDPFTETMKFHRGVDIGAPHGTPISAPASGVVVRITRSNRGYGNVLEIDHGGGYVTRYGQLSAFDVDEGDRVAAGDTIARVGSSGWSTGPHLHVEVYKDGEIVDPAAHLILPNTEG